MTKPKQTEKPVGAGQAGLYPALQVWTQEITQQLPRLSAPQVRVLALWSLGRVLAQAALDERNEQRQPQTRAQVNRALRYVTLCDRVVTLLADPRRDLKTVRDERHRLFQQTPTRTRPGRQSPRKKRTHSMKLRYIKYFKRINA